MCQPALSMCASSPSLLKRMLATLVDTPIWAYLGVPTIWRKGPIIHLRGAAVWVCFIQERGCWVEFDFTTSTLAPVTPCLNKRLENFDRLSLAKSRSQLKPWTKAQTLSSTEQLMNVSLEALLERASAKRHCRNTAAHAQGS